MRYYRAATNVEPLVGSFSIMNFEGHQNFDHTPLCNFCLVLDSLLMPYERANSYTLQNSQYTRGNVVSMGEAPIIIKLAIHSMMYVVYITGEAPIIIKLANRSQNYT